MTSRDRALTGLGARHPESVTYRAATALPHNHRERAEAGLRGQLRLMAASDGAVPDWSTMIVEGPTEALGLHGAVWFEWVATVAAGTRAQADDRRP